MMKVFNSFSFTGKISPIKETDTLKGYREQEFDSGWVMRTLVFSVTSGNDRHTLTVKGGRWKDEDRTVIKTMSESGHDDKGNVIKGEKMDVAFADRFDPDIVSKVASFRKTILDLDSDTRRRVLKKIVDDGSATETELNNAGISDVSEAKEEYKASLRKKFEFISEWDYCEKLNKLLTSKKYENAMFKITGNVEYDYNPSKNIFYRSFVPNRIRIVTDDEVTSEGIVDFYFTKDAVDKEMASETGKYVVNGYTRSYIGSMKKEIGVPLVLNIVPGDNEKLAEGLCRKLTCDDDDTYRHIGLKVKYINGAQRMAITYDMLNDEQKESIDFGLCTLEDIQRELGGSVYGEREQYVKVVGLASGSTSGAEDSVYTAKDFEIPATETQTESVTDDEIDDLFDDDDDIL